MMMMNSQLRQCNSPTLPSLSPKHYLVGSRRHSLARIPIGTHHHHLRLLPNNRRIKIPTGIRATLFSDLFSETVVGAPKTSVAVKAVVTVKRTVLGGLTNIGLTRPVDELTDFLGKTLRLELVSAELDPKTGVEKERVRAYAEEADDREDEVKYEASFVVPTGFGDVGAILVENRNHKEMHLQDIVLHGFPNGPLTIPCNSWVHAKSDNPKPRIFFTNKSYLPTNTPNGIKRLRETELIDLRGNGEGKRELYERIYDYDSYNDLGDPDTSPRLARPVLGGEKHPYPRRCRTGRRPSTKDPLSEQGSLLVYVPRDEAFSEVKFSTLSMHTLKSALHALVPNIEKILFDEHKGFPYFGAIDKLFDEGVGMQDSEDIGLLHSLVPRLVKAIDDSQDQFLRFETPEMIDRDKFAWMSDEEFSRQTLAGLNPYSIQLVTEWPLMSKLDPEIYGPPDSLITTKLVEKEIRGLMNVDEAVKGKRLFMLDYHDLLLTYVEKIREIKGTTLYGSRTLFFLTDEGTLRPIAIELTRPPIGDKPQWKQVFTPQCNATGSWLWRLAKSHVSAHDSGYHQLVSHWLRTHCCVEPYIIAANRQLSAMHPIYRLLHPHFRYTMEINALARAHLINADGIIEDNFFPRKYSMELSSVAYDKLWRFDMEALPADLIRRGMAVEDPDSRHGLKLTIEDYPFANDGLVLWDTIKEWVSEYVNHYYPNPSLIKSDNELQAWWTEVRTKGHTDKKDEPWWPNLDTPADLIQILSTIIWVTSGHHAAVNFGQYTYGGYFPNRPTIARTNMPTEDTSEDEFRQFLKKPEAALLECFPSQLQATTVMIILDLLSSHSPDEEYLGKDSEPSWAVDTVIKAAFERFNSRLKELERIIDQRNNDLNLKNRSGAGIVPYELLKPFSEPGVTGKGVPNSISI